MNKWKQWLAGRELLEHEIPDEYLESIKTSSEVICTKGFRQIGQRYVCERCGEKVECRETKYCQCEGNCGYCRSCIQMGKVKACSHLYHLPEKNIFQSHFRPPCQWSGKLSDQQDQAAKEIIKSIEKRENRLLWAVTGAGKTEMLFPGINDALMKGYRVGLASPRVDVCLELAPRLKSAFPTIDISVLYGESPETYRYTQLVIATTHQLLRFREAFDLLIIDEIDAFPYHDSKVLHFATQKAVKKSGSMIFLTATPDNQLKKAMRSNELVASILPARFHRHPLPVPQRVYVGDWRVKLLKKPKYSPVIRQMQIWLADGKRFLVFLPNIEWMLQWQKLLKNIFGEENYAAVYANDPLRQEKVADFRKGLYHFLLVTTILERGVTFPDIQVMVMGAEDRVFTCSALVQIAGRAGRAKDFPKGEVVFYHYGLTRAIKQACKQIKSMNDQARARGLIDE